MRDRARGAVGDGRRLLRGQVDALFAAGDVVALGHAGFEHRHGALRLTDGIAHLAEHAAMLGLVGGGRSRCIPVRGEVTGLERRGLGVGLEFRDLVVRLAGIRKSGHRAGEKGECPEKGERALQFFTSEAPIRSAPRREATMAGGRLVGVSNSSLFPKAAGRTYSRRTP